MRNYLPVIKKLSCLWNDSKDVEPLAQKYWQLYPILAFCASPGVKLNTLLVLLFLCQSFNDVLIRWAGNTRVCKLTSFGSLQEGQIFTTPLKNALGEPSHECPIQGMRLCCAAGCKMLPMLQSEPQQSRSVYRGPGSGMLASSPRQTIPDAIELSPLPSPAVKRLVRTCPNSFPTFATHAAVWWAAPASFLVTCTVYYSYVCYDTYVHCSYIYRYLLISLPTNSSSMSPSSSSAASLWRNK